MEKLRKCPCCQSQAEFVDVPVSSNSLLWQVTCNRCGLSTELDDDRQHCLIQWNRREREDHLKLVLVTLTVGGALLSAASFVIGILMGINSSFT